jgi:hypothetical protein
MEYNNGLPYHEQIQGLVTLRSNRIIFAFRRWCTVATSFFETPITDGGRT